MIRCPGAVLILLTFPLVAQADNWPGWRGPGNQGISQEKFLPLHWDKSTKVRWKVPVPGNGVSQPVVWEDHIFLTGSDGRLNDQLHVYCYHRNDGKLLWHTRLFGSAPTDLYPPGGMAVPTPVTDGQHLFVLFGTGDLVCLDFAGKPVWMRSLAEEYGPFRNRWGMGTSPILLGDLLLVQVDHWSQSYLLGVDKKTGFNRWKTDRPTSVNWTSPLAVKVKKHLEIVTFGTNFVRSYDPGNGAELWQVEGMHFQCIPSPVVMDNLLFACSGENTMAIRLDGGTGELTKSHVVWKNKKASAFVPSPLAYEGHLYIPGDKSFVSCFEGKTGTLLWKERLGDQFHASPVAGAGRIYFTSKEGVVRVVRSGPTFELLAENDMGESIVASPALSNGQIFLRGAKHLFCIGD
jgi:outer membrane protein assembly factor BamB